jgi:hypothetical protein
MNPEKKLSAQNSKNDSRLRMETGNSRALSAFLARAREAAFSLGILTFPLALQ